MATGIFTGGTESTDDKSTYYDIRNLRAKWLSRLFVVDSAFRVKCSEVIMDLTNAFENISKNECGFVVRQSFPNVQRVHSNHVYYYQGIRRVNTMDNLSQFTPASSSSVVGKQLEPTASSSNLVQEIPRSMYISRTELLPHKKERASYNFPNGNFTHLELRHYRGLRVAVRSYESSIISEAKTVLNLPSHSCLPVLIGVCCDKRPYLLVNMFCGNMRKGIYLSLTGLLKSGEVDVLQWREILLGIAEGLQHMHSCGYVHGDLIAENILLRKEKARPNVFLPVFLNLGEAKPLNKDTHASTYQQDISMFFNIVENIITECHHNEAEDLSGLIELSKLVNKDSLNLDIDRVVMYIKKM